VEPQGARHARRRLRRRLLAGRRAARGLRRHDPGESAFQQSYIAALGRGFAVMSTALDNNGHDCNIAVQAESLMMAKERLVEQYGEIRYTIGTGCSGGSLVQQQISNAYPGIYQGLLTTCAYPDTFSAARSSPTTTCCAPTSRIRRSGGSASRGRRRSSPTSRAPLPRERDRRRRAAVQGRHQSRGHLRPGERLRLRHESGRRALRESSTT
jgi:hypothetical protein